MATLLAAAVANKHSLGISTSFGITPTGASLIRAGWLHRRGTQSRCRADAEAALTGVIAQVLAVKAR